MNIFWLILAGEIPEKCGILCGLYFLSSMNDYETLFLGSVHKTLEVTFYPLISSLMISISVWATTYFL